jgi:cytochrome c oxidase cbb3-type subunit III
MTTLPTPIALRAPSVMRSHSYLVALSLVALAGCDLPGRPNPADRPVPSDKVLEFSLLFQQNCAGCHGNDGKLGAAPPLNDPLFRAIVSEDDLVSILSKGRQKTLMPAFAKENGGSLTPEQIQVLVKEIKGIPYRIVEKKEFGSAKVEVVADASGITPRWGPVGKPPEDTPSYREPSASSIGNNPGEKKKGESVYARACAGCHGDHGQGIERERKTVRTINDPVFLALISNQALRRFAITGRTDLGMPTYAEARPADPAFVPLTDQEVTDLVAMLASWREDK